MRTLKNTITVFGSAIPVEEDEEFETAYRLGCLLGKNNFNVCTGGYKGIMEAVSKGVSENSGEVTGVTLIYNKSSANKYVTKEVKCENLFERIKTLIETGDAFIILQGGTGTLLEFAAVWEFMNKNLIPVKPVACHSLMWSEIGAIINNQLDKEKKISSYLKYFSRVEDLVDYLRKELEGGAKSPLKEPGSVN
jgi:uncharacterized protein (TIGR00725 family)